MGVLLRIIFSHTPDEAMSGGLPKACVPGKNCSFSEKIEFLTKPLYLETDTFRIGLGAALLQMCKGTACQKDVAPDNTTLHPIAFASKSLTGAEHRYSNTEREALGIIHGLEKFLHYCFAREVPIIVDHKTLIAIFKKDVATLSQHIQCILLKIHQYRVQIIYKPGPKIFTADWLS